MQQVDGSATRWTPYRALAWYLALGVVWFWVGSWALPQWVTDPVWLQRAYRAWAYVFVLITGLCAAWLVQRVRSVEARRLLVMQELTQVVRHAPAGIARVRVSDGRIVWANARLAAKLGMSPGELENHDFRTLLQPSNPQWVEMQKARLLAGEIEHYQEERHFTRAVDGHHFTVICTVTAVWRDSPEDAMLVCVVQDITEMKQAREALERSAQQLRLALEGSGTVMWDWDMVRRRRSFSSGAAQMLRYEGQRFARDFRVRERVHPEDATSFHSAVERALQHGELMEITVRFQCFDGVYRWFEVRGMRHQDPQGNVVRFSGTVMDKTAQRQGEERLRQAVTVVENTREGIVVADARSRILSVNPAFTELLGYTEEEMLGETPRMFKSGRHDKAFYDAMWSSVMRTDHWRGEIWNRRKNGEVFPERMSLSAVRDSAGAVTHYVCMFTDISREKQREQQLEFLAHRDALTGLYNRTQVMVELQALLEGAAHTGEIMAVMVLNLNRFKDVNESYGHVVGDEVLKHIARQIKEVLRPGDVIGRMAGDELVVIARELETGQQAEIIAGRLIRAAAQPWKSPDNFSIVMGVCAGISLYPKDAQSASSLLQGAHAAVQAAKVMDRGTDSACCFFDESMTYAARERMALEARLRLAIEKGHLELHYQPQVDCKTGRFVGAEALVRWNDPEEGMISPARFIPVAEKTGLIGPLGEWVIQEACRQGQAWREAGLPHISLAVNVSLHQFWLTDIIECLDEALRSSGYSADGLEVEITESALAHRPEEALQVLRRMKLLGLRLAIDDFGTGYSSLAHLKRFPIDVLKIDQGFIRDISTSSDDQAISNAVIAMGHSMDLQVLAEGVETEEQRAYLQVQGCDYCQGYLFSRPLPAKAFGALLARASHLPAPALPADVPAKALPAAPVR